jgi:hypothetical protein
MAAPVFHSYTWNDTDEADRLDRAMRTRGVPVWRDRRNMGWGQYNQEKVRWAIRERCCGFVLHHTPAVLDSTFVCDIELPAMRRRRQSDPRFFSGAVFRYGPLEEATEQLRERAKVELGEPLGSKVIGDCAGLAPAAGQVLGAYLRSQLTSGEPVTARMETRDTLPDTDSALIHLAWAPPLTHDSTEYAQEVWEQELLPALADLRRELQDANATRVMRLGGSMHLSAALALGFEFREPTGWTIACEHPRMAVTTEMVKPDLGDWVVSPSPAGGDTDGRLVVCVYASQDVDGAVTRHCADRARARLRLDFSPPDGADRSSMRAEHANALAAAIAQRINQARAEYGTSDTHLYLACPWPFALTLGWHLGSCGRVVAHEATASRDNYCTSCVLT